jgi:hypothetical protein
LGYGQQCENLLSLRRINASDLNLRGNTKAEYSTISASSSGLTRRGLRIAIIIRLSFYGVQERNGTQTVLKRRSKERRDRCSGAASLAQLKDLAYSGKRIRGRSTTRPIESELSPSLRNL